MASKPPKAQRVLVRNKPSAFISYSHADRDRIVPIASYFGRLGIKVWMDIKEMAAGQAIVEQVSKSIAEADLYVVMISPSALSSNWVKDELAMARHFEITQGRPRVIPIMIARSEVPASISNRLYVDMTGTFDAGKSALRQAIIGCLPNAKLQKRTAPAGGPPRLTLVSVILRLQSETSKYFGGVHGAHTREEVEAEAADRLKELRRKANGILLNFIPASDMDLGGAQPKFPSGDMSEFVRDDEGEFVGTFNKVAVIEVEIVNPNEAKLDQLVSSKLESLGVSRAVYTFVVAPPLRDLPQRALDRLQKDYIILGWDREQGADVELPDNLKLSIACSDERIRIGIETKYKFEFERRAKTFSVRQFATWLADRSAVPRAR